MDVLKSNFSELCSGIEEDIQKCCFAAVDCEFTGLTLPNPLHPLDTVKERYQKLRAGISDYLVVQFGLSLWMFDEITNTFHVKTYNFYTYPDGKQCFYSQPGCLQFLVQHNFDLNKCVREGLPFLHPKDLETSREKLRQRHMEEIASLLEISDGNEVSRIVDGDVSLAELEARPKPENHVKNADKLAEAYIHNNWPALIKWIGQDTQEELVLPACGDTLRLSFYRHVERVLFNERFKMASVRAEQSENRNVKKIKFTKTTSSPLQRLLETQSDEKKQLEDRYGISRILKTLSESRKPIVGHNNLRDVLHIISQFLTPLPEEYSEFQTMCQEIFPALFDTKYMSTIGILKQYIRGNRLSELYNQVKSQEKTFPMPKIQVEEGFGYSDTTRDHEAGFDAWLTGYIFAAFSQHIAPHKKNCFTKLDVTHESFKAFRNKLNFGPSLDIVSMDLDSFNVTHVRSSEIYIIEWRDPDDFKYVRDILAVVGGSKRSSYGEQVLAFVPTVSDQCVKAIRTQDATIKSCRLYRWHAPKQNRRKIKQKSPPVQSSTLPKCSKPSENVSSRPSLYKFVAHHRSPLRSPEADLPKKPKLESLVTSSATTDPFPEAQQW